MKKKEPKTIIVKCVPKVFCRLSSLPYFFVSCLAQVQNYRSALAQTWLKGVAPLKSISPVFPSDDVSKVQT